ncbi:hypothetical protein HDU76_012873 [Blyttiomyces sp. JEL0837]|nr:hypothetical protein HDU76_012873 [Blyttiomyces sp. JEL0837]
MGDLYRRNFSQIILYIQALKITQMDADEVEAQENLSAAMEQGRERSGLEGAVCCKHHPGPQAE